MGMIMMVMVHIHKNGGLEGGKEGGREGISFIQSFFWVGARSSVGVGCYLTACFTDSWFPLFPLACRERNVLAMT
jgi:hypothetical protein